ncbi:hypothetical protein [Methylobacterium aerolatum]|uniref:Uncharacterized protein n=1 Tax=Methylobacterium aerolatum TaxID=418708 RepID=A0ABU0I1E2_9HYPH|nr:hypothetical protein [Methylobacterium aerolatum]MDQ0448412.1 hypothetical protein [Methylobacterium aerolatum]GJD34494.1 hypothetical protein FMGBMHLM_1395 [Methylobacterium aerolatum]
MKFPIFATLAVLAFASAAEARTHRQVSRAPDPAQVEKVMAPLRQAATDCFAETVMSNPKAIREARAGHWYEAASVTGFLCRPEVAAMIQAHDGLFGPKTGERYFKGAYARHLDKQLAERLQPLLERKAVASAEPTAEKATADEAAPAE